MKSHSKAKTSLLAAVVAAVVILSMSVVTVFAHGGEDHGEKKPVVAATSANMVGRVARAGDLEVMIKHPPIEPDKESSARVLITRFETNEPVEGANVSVMFMGAGGPIEVAAAAGSTPGLYEVKLPPMPEGEYKLSAKVETNGMTQGVEYGAIRVAPLPPPAVADESPWARTLLLALLVLIGLGFVGVVLYRAVQFSRRNQGKGEAATA